jgi:glycosyltransferase involved in cell wall biosynthesis
MVATVSELTSGWMPTISVVTPTLSRPDEVRALLRSLAAQDYLPLELVLIDATPSVSETHRVVQESVAELSYAVTYIRDDRGTAIQRNVGIDAARGELIAFIDDDMLLASDFFSRAVEALAQDQTGQVAAVAGYVMNEYFDGDSSQRWRWYRRLRLFTLYEPGRFDYDTGYVINHNMQPPHEGIREIDCMGAACAVWRRKVFETGIRFSPFFVDYGVGEDAHIALTARKAGWIIWECGNARCVHLRSPRSRKDRRRVAWKTAVNYRFVFVDIVPRRSLRQEFRFWRVQLVQLCHEVVSAFRRGRKEDWASALGKLEGIIAAIAVRPLAAAAAQTGGVCNEQTSQTFECFEPASSPALAGGR